MNISHINPYLIFTKSVFVTIFHPYVSVKKAAGVKISSIDFDKIFVFQVNFNNVFGFVMEVDP